MKGLRDVCVAFEPQMDAEFTELCFLKTRLINPIKLQGYEVFPQKESRIRVMNDGFLARYILRTTHTIESEQSKFIEATGSESHSELREAFNAQVDKFWETM
jgi:hypothetical protein